MNNRIVNYESFYQSARDFLVLTKIASNEDFLEVKESEIYEVEEFIGRKFPKSLFFFQKIFGKTEKKIPTGFPINLNKIKNSFLKSKAILESLRESNYIVGTDGFKIVNREIVFLDMIDEKYSEPEIADLKELFDVKDMLFLDVDFHTDFIDSSSDDSQIHHFINNSINGFTTGLMPLSTYVRANLFSEIIPKLGWNKNQYIDIIGNPEKDPSKYYENQYEKIEALDISKLEWVDKYDFIYKEGGSHNSSFPINVFRKYRNQFYKLNHVEEQKNGYVLTVNEFEWKFIDYLKKKGYQL